ncbi:MAG: nuclear transport factor 2 family protein [Lysobacterales bacterium]
MSAQSGCPRVVSVLFAFVAPIAWAAPATTAQTQAELVNLTRELMDALPGGNAAAWQRILADDALIVDEFGRRQNKAEIVKDIHPFPGGFSGSIEIRDPQLRLHGDTAVLQGEEYEQETVFGQQLVVRYIFSNTFVRRDGAWKLLAAIDVTLPTPPPALVVDDLRLDDYPGVYRYGPGRAFTLAIDAGALFYTTRAGSKRTRLDVVARDVFMDDGDERNLLIFRRGGNGRVVELIERRKFNDLHLKRENSAVAH